MNERKDQLNAYRHWLASRDTIDCRLDKLLLRSSCHCHDSEDVIVAGSRRAARGRGRLQLADHATSRNLRHRRPAPSTRYQGESIDNVSSATNATERVNKEENSQMAS